MVILKEDNVPVLQWPLGRIIKVYKGEDGLVRVCDIQTKKGVFKRPVHRLAPLFPEDDKLEDPTFGKMTERKIESEQTQETPTSPPVSLIVKIPLNRIRKPESLVNGLTPTKRSCLNSGLLLTIITLLILPLALCSPVNITTFNNKPGIYFEQLKPVKIMSADWKMIVYFDLSPYQQQMSILADGTKRLNNLCDKALDNTACKVLLNYFDRITEELQMELNLLSVRKRITRGAIDIVGNFANSLFGVLDSNYAAQMSSTINGLKRNDNHLEQLVKNQTSLVDSTINIFKKNQLNMHDKFEEIEKRINNLLYTDESINDIHVTQNMLMLSMQMLMMVSNLQRVHSSIMDVLIDSHHDKINPLLLTPQQLSEQIMMIRAHLPSHLQLPIHHNNLLEVYRLMKINGILAKGHVIFCIDLPLTDPREFQLLYLVPIVAAINNTLLSVKLSTEFLAISPHHDEFRPMTQHQVDACISISDEELLCPNIQATFHESANVNNCEIDLFNNQAKPRCDMYQLKDTTVWYQLNHPNQWIYATINNIKMNAVCNKKAFQLTLVGSGLIKLEPECIIKNEHITIQGHQKMVTSMQASITRLNLSVGWTKQYASNNISVKPLSPTIHELELIQRKLGHIQSSSFPTDAISPGTHSLITSYVALAMFLCVASALLYIWRRQKITYQTPPIPMPRHQQMTEDTAC
ncbi:uncharacterized protein LOC119688618 [Teleopsis dalmanni]|uniref:uncharacterized protein LOC119664168 n=1 Tax=Teleopsis dalmanni TaxID=139649 RepID=UPI0018CED983|nr:uncharacterized protein LOC119664168 [Teleopsis dalmanni]XP_037959218.1 uncharacterized protein LOC119688618 [Teleopsis dalmanni]